MAALILPSRRISQPGAAIGPDWANPLTRGLVLLDGAPGVNQSVNFGQADYTFGTANVENVTGKNGRGVSVTAEGDFYLSYGLVGQLAPPYTVVFQYVLNVAPSSALRMFGNFTASNDGYNIAPNQTNGRFLVARVGTNTVLTGGAHKLGVVRTVVGVVTASTVSYYEDGVLVAGPTSHGGVFAAAGALRIGADSSSPSGARHTAFFAALYSRALADAEAREISRSRDAPWQLFRPIQRRIWVPVAGGGGDVTGSLNATETGSDTFASSGTVLVSGALSVTESGSDTFSSSGAVVVSGSLAVTESGPDTFAASGLLGTSGSLSVTESGPDTFSATGTTTGGVSGSLDATEAGSDTVAVSGVVVVAGSLAVTESGAETFAASGAVVVAGLLNATESGPDTFAAVGFGGAVTGSLNATESGSDTFVATEEGQLIDTHDGFWAKEWKRIRAREKRKYQEEIQERVEEIQDEIAEVEQQIVEVKQAPKPKKATPARDFYAEQARIVEHLIARRNQLIDEEDEELLLLL